MTEVVELPTGHKLDVETMAGRSVKAMEAMEALLPTLPVPETLADALDLTAWTAVRVARETGGLVPNVVLVLGGLEADCHALQVGDVNDWGVVARYVTSHNLKHVAVKAGARYLVTVSHRLSGGIVANDPEVGEQYKHDLMNGLSDHIGLVYSFTAQERGQPMLEAYANVVTSDPTDPKAMLRLEPLHDDDAPTVTHGQLAVRTLKTQPSPYLVKIGWSPAWWIDYTPAIAAVTAAGPMATMAATIEACADLNTEPSVENLMTMGKLVAHCYGCEDGWADGLPSATDEGRHEA